IKGAGNLLTFLIILIVDIALGFFAFKLFSFGYTPLGIYFVIIILMISVAFLVPKAYMFKWMAVGLSAWLLFSIFPIIYTIYIAFTNYGDGHLISKAQAIEQRSEEHTSELQSRENLVCRLLLEKKKHTI